MSNMDIVFKNVSKVYEKNTVIEDLNLQIKEGERLILLGPSGCGKSTTLRMIAGLESISSGELIMEGKCVNDIPAGKRNVSMVFQNYALYPHMTVRDNICYALAVHKVDKKEIQERLEMVLHIFGLESYVDRKPKELSGGQRQRVALARALVKRSRYLLLDEPLSNLDAQLRLQARKELVKVHQYYHQTFVYVTHDQVEAMTLGNRIALMREGNLQMLDTPYNVYHRPANVFTARFIGSPSTNIVEAQWQDGRMHVNNIPLRLPPMWEHLVVKSGKNQFYLGIRPEDICLRAGVGDDTLNGEIDYIEDYGNKLGIYFSLEGQEIIAVGEHIPGKSGDVVSFLPDYEKLYIFDRETGESIGYPRELDLNVSDQEKKMREILSEGSQAQISDGGVIHVHR